MENQMKLAGNTPANMKARLISAGLIFLVMVAAFFLRELSSYVFDLFLGCIMILGAYEVDNLLKKMDRPTFTTAVGFYPVLIFIFVIVAVNSNLNYFSFVLFNLLALVILFVLLFAIPLIFQKVTKSQMAKDGHSGSMLYYAYSKSLNTIFVCLWPTFFLSFAFVINHFTQMELSSTTQYFTNIDIGLFGLILLFATTILADTFAMLSGRLIKTPKISITKLGPGKSWSGLVGGILGATIASVLVFVIFNYFCGGDYLNLFNALDLNIFSFVIIGLFAGVFNMAGDLFSSLFKRRAVVKDFSQLIPGHGGVMDRVNGLLTNALFIFVVFIIIFG